MNYFEMKIKAISSNESFARSSVAAFALSLNPTLEEINDIKTAVSEAITNSVVHAYDGIECGEIFLKVVIKDNVMEIIISDNGVGIEDVEKALVPFYTTKPDEERSGMGFTLMQSFMDSVSVTSKKGEGTTVVMVKTILEKEEVDA